MVAFGGLLMIALLLTYRRWLVPARGRGLATVGTTLAAISIALPAIHLTSLDTLCSFFRLKAEAPEFIPSDIRGFRLQAEGQRNYGTLNSPSGGGVTAFSCGFGTCASQPYGMR